MKDDSSAVTGWIREWQELMEALRAWRANLTHVPTVHSDEELRDLLVRRERLADQRRAVRRLAREEERELPELDPDPWRFALRDFRRHRHESLLAEAGEEQSEESRAADRHLVREEMENHPDGLFLLPHWHYFGRMHKALDHARVQRETTAVTRIHEFHSLFAARERFRHVTLYLGPTNSGKTYQALRRLAEAANGIYLAPLRLLALEVAETLNAWGVPCNMITGEERIEVEGARHTACTIEMLPLDRRYEVCVIDEAQMLGDSGRGWAWTQAVLGVAADEVNIVGAPESRPALEKLLALTGDPYEIHYLERLAPLQLLRKPVKGIRELEPGTAIILFSRQGVLNLKAEIERSTGIPTAVLYGALPPEVRRRQAQLFASGETPLLVATDAIGMGLNLPIRTLLFAQDTKVIDRQEHPLTPMEVRQIAGRAGRFGKNEVGFVGTYLIPMHHISTSFRLTPHPVKRAHLAPNLDHLLAIASLKGERNPALARLFTTFVQTVKPDPEVYELADLEDQIVLARIADRHRNLGLATRFALSAAPVPLREASAVAAFETMTATVARGRVLSLAKVLPEQAHGVVGGGRLGLLEAAMRVVTLYCWLHFRFPEQFPEIEEAEIQRRKINQEIGTLLKRERHRERTCSICASALPPKHEHAICDPCFVAMRARSRPRCRPPYRRVPRA
ncbi:MAG: RNA helicase [Magnetococcales bacterium]|nr:RNA helicase [Magnetococcales bacterium]